ncbi:MAG: ATP synthase F1 subunit gamma, partial [Deltaproteobacteria bacterium]
MATLRDILRKIGAVKKTRQITKAMNMVAAAKLRNTQSRMESFDPYARKFAEVLGHLASRLEPDIHPLLVKRQEVKNVELLHFSADRGLCGAFNTHLIAEAEKWIKEQEAQGRRCTLTLVGKKGKDYFSKRDFHVRLSHTHIYGKVDISFINQMAKDFIERYLSNEVDEVYMRFSRFVSMVRQEPTLVKLIPIEPPGQEEAAASSGATEYLIEPGAGEVLIELLPEHLSAQPY